ncbi:MAG: hypothetical protein QOC65_515, partial [Sphingomonadales bacterium]|nr:hypothetical protein [Sphingomonadales bacterium]
MPNTRKLLKSIIDVSEQVLPLLGGQAAGAAAALRALERRVADLESAHQRAVN